MSRPTICERVRGAGRGRRLGSSGLLVRALLALGALHCTFPEYDIDQNFHGGGGGSGGNGAAGNGAAGSGGTSVNVGGAGAPASEAGASGMSEAGAGGTFECAGDQWPVVECSAGCLRQFPDHCYNGELDPEESAVDCGSQCQRCSNEQCSTGDDCLSGECELSDGVSGSCRAALTLSLTVHEMNAAVSSTAWSAVLLNSEPVGGESFAIKDLEVRYYLTRGGVIEPIVVRATQANLQLADGQNFAVTGGSWLVERFEMSPDYDAYVSVRFDTTQRLFPGDKMTVYQQMLTGDQGNSSFDQRGHYSFATGPDVEALRMTIFHQGRLVWGLEPRPSNPRACFARGVNLTGTPVTVNGRQFESDAESGVTGGSDVAQGNTPYPEVSDGLAAMLSTASKLTAGQSDTLELPTDNGEYLLYLYAVSFGNDANPGVLAIQGVEPDDSRIFRAQAVDAGWAWARLGPYRVQVTEGTLSVAVTSGVVHFAGLELWYAE